ncbi:MAG: hybrid sensor histidine kinase/response regulator [Rikenellaceae bacterium]|nr:hybrid sensor histidine kinase/response regulator [Rikenellaceae bacterium]
MRSTNADGTWVDNERQLVIVMLPSFWQTGWSRVLVILLLLGVIAVGTYILHTIFRLKNEVRMEARLAEMKLGFFTDISHEIRTPLTLITAPVDHLLHDGQTPEPIRRQLDFVSRNTARMLRMINQILDLRRAQNGPIRLERFVLGEFLRVLCRTFDPHAEQRQIDFAFEDHSAGARVSADRDAVEKIMYNLLSNAFKYTAPGQSIRVRLSVEAGRFRLEVRDSGKGIEPEHIPHIFDRFYTADPTGASASSGIGLSMVQELIRKHGGEIRMKSTPGQGSVFTVWLKADPVSVAEASGIDTGTGIGGEKFYEINGKVIPVEVCLDDAPGKPLNGDRSDSPSALPGVLVVEDDSELRAFLESILAPRFQVFTAENGRQGLDLATERMPELIVSDVMMPELDGIGLLQA